MKRSIFVLTAVLLLVTAAAPLMAQTQDQTQPYENRTNPNAPSLTENSGLTITGTVVSVNDTSLVLDTASGQLTIQLNDATQKPQDLQAGDKVGVDYTRTAQGVMIASQIRPSGEESTEAAETDATASTATTTEESSETAAEENAEAMNEPSEATESSESELNEDTYSQPADTGSMNQESSAYQETNEQALNENEATEQTSAYSGENLPATGSDLPLLGLLGLLSLAGAVGIRSLTR